MNEEENATLIDLVTATNIRCAKMSYLLGLATGGIYHIIQDETAANFQKEPLINLLALLQKDIDELYYNKPLSEVKL